MELPLFDQVGEVVRTMVHDDGRLRLRAHRRGVKVWFGPATPTRQHFEAQIIPSHLVDPGTEPNDAGALVIEVGWHSEDPDEGANEAALAALGRGWEGRLGDAAQAGPFLGNDGWRRLSETWDDVDLDDPDLAFELAARLVDYIDCIGALRGGGPT